MKVAFLFDRRPAFPPDFNNMKCFYVSEEMANRGIGVVWLNLNRHDRISMAGGIDFVNLRVPSLRVISALFAALRIVIYCLVNSVGIVYVDEWFCFRDSPFRQLATVLTLRVFGFRVVIDRRDPYLDFEVARGAVQLGTLRYRVLKIHEKATLYACSLLILPSKAYENLLISEGAPTGKVKGFFRGIDLEQFNPSVSGNRIRAQLGLERKFVVGWFGMMYRHRLVEEVLIPLAKSLETIVPNGRMLLGGKGALEVALRKAKRGEMGDQFDYVGAVEYPKLPEYLSACDLLLCPINAHYRFSRHSNWLKILEGLAMGVPVIATKTEISLVDFRMLKGIVWTGGSLADFQVSILSAYGNIGRLKAEARAQAAELFEFGIDRTVPLIVDQILQGGYPPRR